MSREIKFKAWSESLNDMFGHEPEHGTIFDFKKDGSLRLLVANDDSPHGHFEEVEDAVFMQDTGIKDKNGVNIYEGFYIAREVLVVNGHSAIHTGVVKNHEGRWVIESKNKVLIDLYHSPYSRRENEVIGNIYENPELLEERK